MLPRVYNDWIADFQAYAPERFVCNGTLPTTGLDDAIAELHRCAELGLRTVQLESYPSGSFSDPSPEDDRFWAAAVELGMPINVHTQFFFPVGDLGSKITADGVRAGRERAKQRGLDVQAGSFPVILWRMTQSGVFERFPDLQFVGSEVHTGWVPYYLERFDDSVRRNRREWALPLLPSEYFRQNVSVVYIVDEVGAHNRYDIGVANIMWGPDFPHSSSAWPVDYELGLEILKRAGASESEIERIMWKNAADIYKVAYDAAMPSAPASRRDRRRTVVDPTGSCMAASNDYKLISADSHVLEPPTIFEAGLPASLRDRAPKLVAHDGGSVWSVDGELVPLPSTAATGSGWHRAADGPLTDGLVSWDAVLPALYDPAERVQAQWSDSVDGEVLYPSTGLWDAIKMLDDDELKVALIKAYNDWIAEFCAYQPDRLFGVAKLPGTSVRDAQDELSRCVNELGLRGRCSIRGRAAHQPVEIRLTSRSGRRSTISASRSACT